MPELLVAINLNRCLGHVQSVMALKFLLMSFLRAGAFARLEWKWISKKDNLLAIPVTTPVLSWVPLLKEGRKPNCVVVGLHTL